MKANYKNSCIMLVYIYIYIYIYNSYVWAYFKDVWNTLTILRHV